MLTQTTTLLLLALVLAVFATVGVRAGREGRDDVEDFTLARNSQGPARLGWSFLASGLGAWILFAPAELGAILGVQAVVGYAVAAAAPFLVIAVVGPRLRRLLPHGHGLNELVRLRFGPAAGTVVSLLSLLYMGVFVAAELVAVGGVGQILGGVAPATTILAVVLTTLAYTAWGGLRASLRTDSWQSWLVVALMVVAAIATVGVVDGVGESVSAAGLARVDRGGLEAVATLVIAVTAANLFHHGYWQRVWAARDDVALRRGAVLGAAATVPVMLVAGGFGVLAAAGGLADVPALSLFALAADLPAVIVAGVLVLGVALVASSVDTLENGLAALLIAERPTASMARARVLTVLVVVPAVGASLVVDSVLRLFLVADLLCTALVVPALLGMWHRTTTAGVVAGAVGGLVGALAGAATVAGSLAGALEAASFPGSIPTLAPFVGALVGGAVGTVGVSLVGARSTDLSGLDVMAQGRSGA